jgi:hypothetical protein
VIAAERLRRLAGKDFDFDVDADEQTRKQAVERLRARLPKAARRAAPERGAQAES